MTAPFPLFQNNAASSLAVAVTSNTQASLTLQTGHGARFPSPLAPDYFMVTLDDGTNVEVCKCIARSGDVLTVLRGYEGTTAQSSFAVNVTKVEHRLTAMTLDRFIDRSSWPLASTRPIIGVASWQNMGFTLPTVIGTVAGQVLTNSSYRGQQLRTRITSAASASTPAHIRNAQPAASGQPGFRFTARFGFAIAPSSSHFFIGLVGTTGVVGSTSPPSSLTNAMVLGFVNSGLNSNLSIWKCNSATGADQIDLGSYFTVTTQAWYQFELQQAPGDSTVYYTVRRMDVSSIPPSVGSLTSNIPSNSLWLSPFAQGVTLTNSTFALEFGGWLLE